MSTAMMVGLAATLIFTLITLIVFRSVVREVSREAGRTNSFVLKATFGYLVVLINTPRILIFTSLTILSILATVISTVAHFI